MKLTKEKLDFFKTNRIYFSDTGEDRLREGEDLFFDEGTSVEPYCAFLRGNTLVDMGSFSYSHSELPPGVIVGRYCSIASGLTIIGLRHPLEYVSTSPFTYNNTFIILKQALEDAGVSQFPLCDVSPSGSPVGLPIIKNDVWIGQNATLARGVVLGNGCIVGANAVVTKSVPPYAIVGGNPAKVIRMRFPDNIIEALEKAQWWQYGFFEFKDIPERQDKTYQVSTG